MTNNITQPKYKAGDIVFVKTTNQHHKHLNGVEFTIKGCFDVSLDNTPQYLYTTPWYIQVAKPFIGLDLSESELVLHLSAEEAEDIDLLSLPLDSVDDALFLDRGFMFDPSVQVFTPKGVDGL